MSWKIFEIITFRTEVRIINEKSSIRNHNIDFQRYLDENEQYKFLTDYGENVGLE